jgi:hypothetical protein
MIYCYTRGDETIGRVFPMGKAPRRVRHQGKTFCRDWAAEQRGSSAGKKNLWPHT